MPGLWGYHAALSTLLEFGPEEIEARLGTLTEVLMREFANVPELRIATPVEPQHRAGIVTIVPDKGYDTGAVFRRMLKRKMTPALRQGMIRFSPHFYMKEEEAVAAASLTRECVRSETE